jgi:hypothetical protein
MVADEPAADAQAVTADKIGAAGPPSPEPPEEVLQLARRFCNRVISA